MSLLITSDLHLTDRPRDAYRFGLFRWLAKQQVKYQPQATFILGDITDAKDRHPAGLVNRIVDELTRLKPPVYLLKGNHDYLDSNNPFFGFLNNIEGIEFIIEPRVVGAVPGGIAMIPHCQNQAELDKACGIITPKMAGVMCHQTFEGAKAETGARLSGLRASPIEAKHPRGTWVGDVHKPQRVGLLTYIGAPYHVRFGDDFTPRVLLVRNGVESNLYYDSPLKWVLHIHDHKEIAANADLRQGDQVKVVLELAREEVVEWQHHRQLVVNSCKKLGLELYGIDLKVASGTRRERSRVTDDATLKSPEEVFDAFCQNEGVASNIKKAGLRLLSQ